MRYVGEMLFRSERKRSHLPMTQTSSKLSLGVTDALIASISEDRKSGVNTVVVTDHDKQQCAPSGGALTDMNMRGDCWLRLNLGLTVAVQHEKRLFLTTHPGRERKVGASIEIRFRPQKFPAPSAFHVAHKATGGGDPN
jgi:hypothetical protein